MASHKSPDNFIKVLQALQHACQKSTPYVKKVVDAWHAHQKQTQKQCSQPQICSGITGKPKSCSGCVDWGKAVEAAYYPKPAQIAWRNIDTTLLHNSAIEVCNGFALNLPSGQKPTKLTDYDTASILKIMMGFGPFHQSNQPTSKPYDYIKKVM